MKLSAVLMLAAFLTLAISHETISRGSYAEDLAIRAPTVYDASPAHIWNRLYAALLIRQDQSGSAYGVNALDPPLWPETEHLLSGPSHQLALNLLDEFLSTHAENQIHDPLKRALLQRSLWAVFDWSTALGDKHATQRRELQIRLAEVLRRLSLTVNETKSLPNNYAEAIASGAFATQYDPAHPDRAFLPPDLFAPRGPWVCVKENLEPLAITHMGETSGRSRFAIFVRLPEGRKATLEYFQTVWNVPDPWAGAQMDPGRGDLSPKLPQFPVGTQVALLRQMMLFDRAGSLVPTPITESLQIRVYRQITNRRDRNNVGVDWPAARIEQAVYEIRLDQAQLFAGKAGGLRAVAHDETEFAVFSTQGNDAFEPPARGHGDARFPAGNILGRCAVCHSAPGINSVQIRRQLLRPNPAQLDPEPPYDSLWWASQDALSWKARQYDWGLLNGYWQAVGSSH